MKIIPGDIKRTRPRMFIQLGTVIIQAGDTLTQIDWGTTRAYQDREVFAKRVCQKNGKPLGPWLYIVQNRTYQIPMEKGD